MTAEFIVEHETRYRYASQVAFAQHLACLRPLDAPGQTVASHAMDVDPAPSDLRQGRDVFGNHQTYFSITRPHLVLRVRARSRVRLQPRFEQLDFAASPAWEPIRQALTYSANAVYNEAAEFCFDSPRVPRARELREYAQASFRSGAPLLFGALDLMRRIHRDFRYDAASTHVATPLQESFAARAGVCQDFSHIMIGCLRSVGLAARYVSGYLDTRPRFAATPGGDDAAQPVVGADASHAWVAVWCPRFGWVEFDPTNNAVPGTGHVLLAIGRDYGDVAPLRGVVQGGGDHSLEVAVQVLAVRD
jgi:transglutaminase-like putative cysteine protease